MNNLVKGINHKYLIDIYDVDGNRIYQGIQTDYKLLCSDKLGNIYFTAPGPENHMLLIKGYNFNDKSFTTNDPGTRRGEGYTYDENVLFEAIRDYPTGYHLPNDIILKKVILIKK